MESDVVQPGVDAASYKAALEAEIQKENPSERVIRECISRTFSSRTQMLQLKYGPARILQEFGFFSRAFLVSESREVIVLFLLYFIANNAV